MHHKTWLKICNYAISVYLCLLGPSEEETYWFLPTSLLMTVWPQHKCSNTLSKSAILTVFPLQKWWHASASMLCYTHFGVFLISVNIWVGRDGVDGVSTYSVWEGPTVEYMWGQYFPHQSKPTQEPPCFVCNRVLGLLHGVERWVGGVDCSPWSIVEVQERAQYWVFFTGRAVGGWRWPPTSIYCWSARKSEAKLLLPLWVLMACFIVNLSIQLLNRWNY